MSINHEPHETPEPPVTLVSRSKFETLATTLGAVVELTEAAYYVTWNERVYMTPREQVAS